jgi:hypothetical protein
MDSALLLAIEFVILSSLAGEQLDKLQRNSHVHSLHRRHVYDHHAPNVVTKYKKGENYKGIKVFSNPPSKV